MNLYFASQQFNTKINTTILIELVQRNNKLCTKLINETLSLSNQCQCTIIQKYPYTLCTSNHKRFNELQSNNVLRQQIS